MVPKWIYELINKYPSGPRCISHSLPGRMDDERSDEFYEEFPKEKVVRRTNKEKREGTLGDVTDD